MILVAPCRSLVRIVELCNAFSVTVQLHCISNGRHSGVPVAPVKTLECAHIIRIFRYLSAVSYSRYFTKSISSWYHTAQIQSPTVAYCTEPISPQYHTAQSISQQYHTVLRGVMWLFRTLFKGTFQWDFRLTVFFHHSNLPGPLTKRLNIFDFVALIIRINYYPNP